MLQVSVEKPESPVFGKVTHRTIELIWKHVKDALPAGRFKFTLQEFDKKKKDWNNVYTYKLIPL